MRLTLDHVILRAADPAAALGELVERTGAPVLVPVHDAGAFTSGIVRASVDVEKGATELRMLSQPVYRFEPEAKSGAGRAPDGALFAYVLTTDPEAWLLIEERPAGDGPAWHYAFARMTNHSASAKHGNRTVWSVEKDPDDGNPGKPFCSRWDVGPKP